MLCGSVCRLVNSQISVAEAGTTSSIRDMSIARPLIRLCESTKRRVRPPSASGVSRDSRAGTGGEGVSRSAGRSSSRSKESSAPAARATPLTAPRSWDERAQHPPAAGRDVDDHLGPLPRGQHDAGDRARRREQAAVGADEGQRRLVVEGHPVAARRRGVEDAQAHPGRADLEVRRDGAVDQHRVAQQADGVAVLLVEAPVRREAAVGEDERHVVDAVVGGQLDSGPRRRPGTARTAPGGRGARSARGGAGGTRASPPAGRRARTPPRWRRGRSAGAGRRRRGRARSPRASGWSWSRAAGWSPGARRRPRAPPAPWVRRRAGRRSPRSGWRRRGGRSSCRGRRRARRPAAPPRRGTTGRAAGSRGGVAPVRGRGRRGCRSRTPRRS